MGGIAIILACLLFFSRQGLAAALTGTSVKRANIGDYVAAGLGISVQEPSTAIPPTTSLVTTSDVPAGQSSSTSAPTDSSKLARSSDSTSESQLRSTKVATSTTASPSGQFSRYGNVSLEATKTVPSTDCWHSWLDYWSASSLNQPTYTTSTYVASTITTWEEVTEHTLIPTSTWISYVRTETLSYVEDIYSDGYRVSDSVSYSTSTTSFVGWFSETMWSSLGYYKTTYVTTEGYHDDFETTQVPTALPTPRCDLPAVVPECSSQWHYYFHNLTERRYLGDATSGYFEHTPDCRQASITGELCTSMKDIYFYPESMFGHTTDLGWMTVNGSSYFPASKSLAPGCSLGCQACSITGESVQLYYWPTHTATLAGNVTKRAFVTAPASMRTVSIDGTVLTSPTVYISYDILHAGDSCGVVGKTYRNTIVPLSNTNHLYSMDFALNARGYDIGYLTKSFNLADLAEPVPDSIYNKQSRCKVSSNAWHNMGQNGDFSCARTESYAPIIAVPPEVRALDPAWESCQAWYGGLFDPPRALQPADAIAVPTMPSTLKAPAATPESSVDPGLPVETSAPTTTSASLLASKGQHTEDFPNETHKPDLDDPNNDPASDSASINIATSSTESQQEPTVIATEPNANTADHSEGVAAIASMLLSHGAQASDGGTEHAPSTTVLTNGPQDPTTAATELNANTQAASQGVAAIASILLSQGPQTSNVGGEHLTTTGGQEPTAVQRPDGSTESQSSRLSMGTATVDHGAVATSGTEGVIAGGASIDHSISLLDNSSGRSAAGTGHAESEGDQSGHPNTDALPSVTGGRILSDGTITVIDSHATSAEDATALSTLDTFDPIATTGASVVIAGQMLTAVQSGADVLIADTQLTVGQVATIADARISVASDRIVVGSSTASFRELVSSAADPGHIVTTDGTALVASGTADQTGAAGGLVRTISKGGPAATIDGRVITNGPDGVSLINPSGTAMETAITGLTNQAIIIGRTTYKASPVSGDSSAVILQPQTSSTHDPDVTAADQEHHSSKSRQTYIASATSQPSHSASSDLSSSTDDTGSDSSQQSTAAPTEEGSASGLRHVSCITLLFLAVLLAMIL